MRRLLLPILLLAAPARAGELPQWAPDPKLVARLEAETATKEYALRLPRGYDHLADSATTVGVASYWRGGTRRDGTAPTVGVAVLRMPRTFRPTTQEALLKGLDEAVTRALTLNPMLSKKLSKVTRGPTEYGRVGELTFGSARWSAVLGPRKVPVTGFVYVTMGKSVVSYLYGDLARHAEETIAPAEASALTLKPK